MISLRRVEQNDPILKYLSVRIDADSNNLGMIDYYWPNDSANLERLSNAIGASTELKQLTSHNARALEDMTASNDPFFDGHDRNTSFWRLSFEVCNLSGGVDRRLLNKFVETNDINLISIQLAHCDVGNNITGFLVSTLSR